MKQKIKVAGVAADARKFHAQVAFIGVD